MSGFRARPKSFDRLTKTLREKARSQDLNPADLDIYPSKRPSKYSAKVSVSVNAIQISDRMRFTLRATGEPFKYHGVLTKRYPLPKLRNLLALSAPTIWRYVKEGVFPEPALIVQGKVRRVYWLYHQAEPMFVWYHQMRSRGIKNLHVKRHRKEISELHRRLKKAESHFFKKFDQPPLTDYEKYAGQYGVLWLMDDEKTY